MDDYFKKLSVEKIKELIGNSFFLELKTISLSQNEDDIDSLIKCLYARYLGEPIKNNVVRRALIETLSEKEIDLLTDKFSKEKFLNKKNNALSLSTINWKKSNSPFISDLTSLLKIPKSELPVSGETITNRILVEPVEVLHPLFEYQEELINIISNKMYKQNKFLIQLPTGAGKTRVLMESIIDYIKRTNSFSNGKIILWLAHSEELCEQAIETCENIWIHKGNSALSIIRLWGSYKHYTLDLHESFIFGSLQKLVSLQNKDDEIFQFIKEHVDVVVVDEAHKTLAPTYKRLVNELAQNAIIIGATATPGRNFDEAENKRLARLFNNDLLTPSFPKNSISFLKEEGILANVNMQFIESKIDIHLNNVELEGDDFNLESSKRVISQLAKSKTRNRLIIENVIKEVDNDFPCIVFSCSVEHSLLLAGAFALSGYNARHIDSSMNKGNRRKTIESFKAGEYDILINYGVLSTGFDSPRIKTVVITRPTSSIILYSQMIGRGLRGPAVGGSKECKIIDIKDNFINYGEVEKVYEFFDDYWN